MSRYVFRMPDLGEGTVEAEIVAWHVKVGDLVKEDQLMAEVMTDKAAVEVPAPVTGRVLTVNGAPGEMVKVGSELIVFETDSAAAAESPAAPAAPPAGAPAVTAAPAVAATPARSNGQGAAPAAAPPSSGGGRVMASPATRRRAREAGIDLANAARQRTVRAHHSRGPHRGIGGSRIRSACWHGTPARHAAREGARAPRRSKSSACAA